jgi:hypothetical protein
MGRCVLRRQGCITCQQKSAAVNAIGALGALSILRSATATMRDFPSANVFSILRLSALGGNQKCCSSAARAMEDCIGCYGLKQ